MNNNRYVIMGCDENEFYLDFWPIISRTWKEKFNITPVLGLICDEDSEIIEEGYGLIKKFKTIQNIDKSLQTQIVRFYLTKILDGNCLISDIDMMPLSKKYFNDLFLKMVDNNILVCSSDNKECLSMNMYPMCYILSSSKIYRQVFDLDLSWESFCVLLNERNEGWYTDQKYLYEKINSCMNIINVTLLKRGWDNGIANSRIDRICWKYDSELVKKGLYIDSHLLRPYKTFKLEIDKLYNLV